MSQPSRTARGRATPADSSLSGGSAPSGLPGSDLIEVPREDRASIEVLIVDDEHSLRETTASLLKTEGYAVTVCGRGHDALDLVRRRQFDIAILDLYMSQVTGLDIMKAALETYPDTLAIVMTGNPSVESSVKALREGAWDYLPKPFSATHFHLLIGRAAHAVTIARESAAQQESAAAHPSADGPKILGRSAAIESVIDVSARVARTDASVFITGESGVGKELIAQYIHRSSRRSSRELVSVNCAAIPEALLESEMFGHVEGAFTGAVRDKEGLLEVANGGTLFLDELTELPLPTQAKLLRVLQDGVVRRVGSSKTDAVVNVRFIAATNDDPVKAIREGRLRKDLHYRLRVVPIHVPPLRERPEDIPILTEHFFSEFWGEHRDTGLPQPTLSEEAVRRLKSAAWVGNVRELRNVLEHLVVMVEPGSEIRPEQIPFIDEGADDLEPSSGFSPSLMRMDYHSARDRVLREFEVAYLKHIVNEADGNISDAARIADVDRTTLYRLMDKHQTERDELIRGSGPDSDVR